MDIWLGSRRRPRRHYAVALTIGQGRSVIAASIWIQDHRHRGKFVTTAVCPFCSSGAPEDLEHLSLELRCLVDHPPAAPRGSIRSRPHLASLPSIPLASIQPQPNAHASLL